jgi:O-antigen/teichoic acid export membrane protein
VPLNVVASLRYEFAIPLPKDPSDAKHLLVLSLGITLVIAGLVAAFLQSFGDNLLIWVGGEALSGYLWLLPINVVFAGVYLALSYVAIRQQAFVPLALSKVAEGVGQSVTQLLFGWLQVGLFGLISGLLVRFALAAISLIDMVSALFTPHWQVSPQRLWQLARSYRKFPQYNASATFLQFASMHLPVLFLAATYGVQVAGWFSLGQRVLEAPITFLSKSASQVYLGELSMSLRQDDGNARHLYSKTFWRQSKLGLLLAVMLILPAPWLFPWLFGETWRVTGVYVQALLLMFISQFLAQSLVAETLTVIGHQRWQLVFEVIKVTMILLIFSLARYITVAPLVTVVAYGGVITLINAVYLKISWNLIKNYDKKSVIKNKTPL